MTSAATVCGLSLSFLLGAHFSTTIESKIAEPGILIPAWKSFATLGRIVLNSNWENQFDNKKYVVPVIPLVLANTFPVQPTIQTDAIKLNSSAIRKIVAAPTAKASKIQLTHRLAPKSLPVKRLYNSTKTKVVIATAPVARGIILNTHLDSKTIISHKIAVSEIVELQELLINEDFAFAKVQRDLINVSIQSTVVSNSIPAVQRKIESQKQILSTKLKARTSGATAQVAKISTPSLSKIKPFNNIGVLKAKEQIIAAIKISDAPVSKLNSQTDKEIFQNFIQGRLLGDLKNYPGHFEIGIYNKIGSDGYPVGAPISWIILPHARTEFRIRLPNSVDIQPKFLFASYFENSKKTWIGNPANAINPMKQNAVVDLLLPTKDQLTSKSAAEVKAANTIERKELKGVLRTMFAENKNFVVGARVRIRGTKISAATNANGEFALDIAGMRGSFLIEVNKAGYLPAIFEINTKDGISTYQFELASKELIEKMALSVGLRQSEAEGTLILKIKNATDQGLNGYSANLSLKASGPFFFNDAGFPVRGYQNRATNNDGRMIFFNVQPGMGSLEIFSEGTDNITPTTLSQISGGELIYKEMEPIGGVLSGKVFDATKKGAPSPIIGARVRIEGSNEWAQTGPNGEFRLPQRRFLRRESVQLEVIKDGFYAHSFRIAVGNSERLETSKNLFMFPTPYINNLARRADVEIDSQLGIIFGATGKNSSVRIDTLADQSTNNETQDFYFDDKQNLKGSHSFTDEKFGTFLLFNVPNGRNIIHGYNGFGELKYGSLVYVNPATVNVILPE